MILFRSGISRNSAEDVLQQRSQAITGVNQAALGHCFGAGTKVLGNHGVGRIGVAAGKIEAFAQPEFWVTQGCRGRMAGQQATGSLLQSLAAQPDWRGQVIPPAVQIGLRHFGKNRIFDYRQVAAFVVLAGNVQGLVRVANEMKHPRQRINFFLPRGVAQFPDQHAELGVELASAFSGAAINLTVGIMPVAVAQRIRETGNGGGGRAAEFVVETVVLTDVVGPVGGLEEGDPEAICVVGIFSPAPIIRVALQQQADLTDGCGRELLPGDVRDQPVRAGIPGTGRSGTDQKEAGEQTDHGDIMPACDNPRMQRLPPDSLALIFLHAARVVGQVMAGRSLAEGLLERVPATLRPAVRDQVYGCLRRYGRGPFFLKRLMNKPVPEAEIHALLLVALSCLEENSETAYTVVNQAVTAAGVVRQGRYKGLVNAVLRSFLRRYVPLQTEAAMDEEASYGHPGWWLAALRADFPAQWREMAEAGNTRPPMAVRVNRRRIGRDAWLSGVQAMQPGASARGRDGVLLEQPLPVERLPGFAEGQVSVQDLGAQRAAELLAPETGSLVLDACAAPGGKTAHLLETADLDLLALDLKPERCRKMAANLERLGLRAEIREADCSRPEQWWDGQPFDAVLADVPCTASGVARRFPDVKWLRRAGDIASFSAVQSEILDALWQVVKPGGKLLYATCSVFAEENSLQMARFVARTPGSVLSHEEQLLPNQEHDGFYYGLLRKNP